MNRSAVSIRKAILAELKRRNKTRYWLARQAGLQPQQVYRMLRTDRFRVGAADRMLTALNLRIKREETTP